MSLSKLAEQLAAQVGELAGQMKQASGPLQQNFEQQQRQFKTQLELVLRKAGVVTQDEFSAQQAVLQRTREKVEALEKLVAKLEEKIQGQDRS